MTGDNAGKAKNGASRDMTILVRATFIESGIGFLRRLPNIIIL